MSVLCTWGSPHNWIRSFVSSESKLGFLACGFLPPPSPLPTRTLLCETHWTGRRFCISLEFHQKWRIDEHSWNETKVVFTVSRQKSEQAKAGKKADCLIPRSEINFSISHQQDGERFTRAETPKLHINVNTDDNACHLSYLWVKNVFPGAQLESTRHFRKFIREEVRKINITLRFDVCVHYTAYSLASGLFFSSLNTYLFRIF